MKIFLTILGCGLAVLMVGVTLRLLQYGVPNSGVAGVASMFASMAVIPPIVLSILPTTSHRKYLQRRRRERVAQAGRMLDRTHRPSASRESGSSI